MKQSSRRWAAGVALAIALVGCSPAAPGSPGPGSPAISGEVEGSEEAAAALRAYEAETAKPNRSFRLVQTGTFSAAGQTFDVRYELGASGRDLKGTIIVGPQTIELVAVDGVSYIKTGDEWQTAPSDTDLTSDILDVFRYVGDSDNLSFVERTDEGGAALFHFRAIEPVPYQTSQMQDQGISGSIPVLDFYIRADGLPVRLTFSSTANRGPLTIEGHSTIEFSKWGEPITIEAPI